MTGPYPEDVNSSSDLANLCIASDCTVLEAIAQIDRNQKGIVLVLDADGRLMGTITDGDVRRLMLAGKSLEGAVTELLDRKQSSTYPQPITAPWGTDHSELLQLMQKHQIAQIPLLDPAGRVVELVALRDLLPNEFLPLQAVIMAGGLGTRLRPLTDNLPKPMLPVGDRPLLELIIQQLRQAGVQRVNITTHYRPDKITDHFGNGSAFGIELNYVSEDRPLGTAGALALLQAPQEPLLVMNGDILTRVDFRAMLTFHQEQQADLTVGVRQYDMRVPYGVVDCEGSRVQRLVEKPTFNFFVNAGIYLLSPTVHPFIPVDQRFDMTDLIQKLLDEHRTVVSFPIWEYWLDIGHHDDYQQAQIDVQSGRLSS